MEEIVQENKILKNLLVAVLVGLVCVLIFLLLLAGRDYRRAKALEAAEQTQSSLSAERRVSGPLSKVEIGDIASWMTFDYVNYLFGLPAGYLKTAVPINDPVYPHLTLSSYARYSNQARATLVSTVQNSVAAYLTASGTTTTR